jgi:rRNA-processing protein FCF1
MIYVKIRENQIINEGGLNMSTEMISIVAIVSIVIWSAVSRELVKSSKENGKGKNGRKIITLMSAGTLSTLLLTISLFQNIHF